MNSILKTEVESGGYGEKWKNEGDLSNASFTANEVIEAYEHGAKDGEKRLFERISTLVHKHTVQAMDACEQIWDHLTSKGFAPIALHLRSDGIAAFVGLFVVEEALYVSEQFDEVYDFVFSVVDKLNTKEYHLAINFLPTHSTP